MKSLSPTQQQQQSQEDKWGEIPGKYINGTELLIQDKGITSIGNLQNHSQLRKLDISFNPIKQLTKLEHIPKLSYLAAYSCLLENIDYLDE